MPDDVVPTVIPLLTPEDRATKETVLAMAELQLAATQRVITRLRRELGIKDER